MTITLKIPKKKKNLSEQINENISLEIYKHQVLKRIAIKFIGGIPSDKVRDVLKLNDWGWTQKYKVWYAKNDKTDEENVEFANTIKKKFFKS